MPPGSVLDPDLGDHVCLPFRGDRERRAVTRLFTLNALRRRAKVLIITYTDSPVRTREWLGPLVPGFAAAESSGRIEIAGARTHFAGGRLDPGKALSGLAAAVELAGRQGHHGLYALVDASWGAHDPPGQVALETAANALFGRLRLALVCQYDRRVFPREAVDPAASAHPISPGQAMLRYAASGGPGALRLWGEIDLTNRQAFASVLESLREERGEVVIDAAGLAFIDAGSAQLLVAMAVRRPPGRTVVVCGARLARLLQLIRGDEVVTVRRAGDV
ncbi:MEDS domain-containing protein [Nonomuraea sp. SBT364]|uniref:MEDS domain-containing protein n=1 Tax=Nonomuraea sp. SBT364 TaxID=1580530 RepID=UPI00066C5223|nr:MEDS domain-containing protein [Nonomuraea sp. SBT364]